MELPAHTMGVPEMLPGPPFTVTFCVTRQPVVAVYVMVVVPAAIPVKIPDAAPMVPVAVLPLTQAPPAGLLVKLTCPPAQSVDSPEIGVGFALTCSR